jgi:hypothetical protein
MCFRAFAAGVSAALVWTAPAAAQDEPKKLEEIVAEQKAAVEALWKRVMDEVEFNYKETEHFLFFSTLAKEDLDNLANSLGKAFPSLKKQASFGPKDEMWPGKLVVCIFDERAQFTVWLRNVEKRMVSKTDVGSFRHERDMSMITAGPPAASVESPPVAVEAINQLAQALLSKAHPSLPEWFVTGFGRAAMYRQAPKEKLFVLERRLAAELVRAGVTAKDVWGGKLGADQGVILHASFVDFLVNSPQVGKLFPEIVANYSSETAFEDALKAAKLSADAVDRAWRAWTPTVR